MWGTELINIITYIIAFIISIIGIIGAIVPVLPGPPISFISILLPYLLCTPAPFTGRFIITWLIITTIVTLIDNFLAPAIVKATGGKEIIYKCYNGCNYKPSYYKPPSKWGWST